MSSAKFKTLRHVETVRNFLNAVIRDLLNRQERHDQSKFQDPEVQAYEFMTERLRGLTYGSDEYRACLREMKPAIDHHYAANPSHHPEAHPHGIHDMNLIDLVEMLCDWKAASLRHADGDITKSIEINQNRFGYNDETRGFLERTAKWLENQDVDHWAHES